MSRSFYFSALLFSLSCALNFITVDELRASVLISQYVETNSGTTPKGIEIWNPTANPIDFSVTSLDVLKGTNEHSKPKHPNP
jgi:hypothetical protein